MPPVKRRIFASIDADVASYLEDLWEEIRRKARKRTVYFSAVMNALLTKLVEEDRVDQRFTEYARERLLNH